MLNFNLKKLHDRASEDFELKYLDIVDNIIYLDSQ